MPDDQLRQLFEHVVRMPVDVPPDDRVLHRGRQRRRRARLQASTVAWTILLAAGFGAPQVSGSLAVNSAGPAGLTAQGTGAPGASYPSVHATGRRSSPVPAGQTRSREAQSSAPPQSSSPSGSTTFDPLASLPPSGGGQLILGLDSDHHYVMTRVGSVQAPVRVHGLTAVAGAPAVLATDPAGGWVVALASHRTSKRVRPARLAVVVATGHSVQFGPEFIQTTVMSAAVSLDGSRVAVAVAGQSGRARIEVLPLPGHRGTRRSWTVPAAQADLVTGLSWAPDGRHVSYLAAERAVTGSVRRPLILNTAAKLTAAPMVSPWPAAMMTGASCVPDAAAWLGRSGRVGVLSECVSTGTEVFVTTDAGTGAAAGPPIVVAHRIGCGPAALDPNASGSRVLISYCGIYLVDRGKLSRASGSLTAAALSG